MLLDLQGEQADFGVFEDVAFEDMDFELLRDPQWDGIEDYGNEQAPHMRFRQPAVRSVVLAVPPDNPVHPYVEGGDDLKPADAGGSVNPSSSA